MTWKSDEEALLPSEKANTFPLSLTTSETFYDFVLGTKGFAEMIKYVIQKFKISIIPKMVGQNIVENFFSIVRQSYRGNLNPTVSQYREITEQMLTSRSKSYNNNAKT